jgi:hypothetical protein
MQKEELLTYIRDPRELNSETLDKITAVRKQYPFFQTVRLLVVKNMHMLGDPDLQTEIENTSAYVTDRRILYELIYPLESEPVIEKGPEVQDEVKVEAKDEVKVEIEDEIKVEVEPDLPADKPVDEEDRHHKPSMQDNISNLLSLQLEELELVDPDDSELVPEVGLDIDKAYGPSPELLTLETESQTEESANASETHSFTEWLSKVDHRDDENKTDAEIPRLVPRHDNKPHVDISENSVKEHDGIFTDTLAKIYVKQGYYSKAIFAYEKLILKYPEKSGYFAGQIEEIKKYINKQ